MLKKNQDFSITIDFDKNSPNPSRVFKSMASIIETFEKLDSDLVRHIDNKIETIMLLEDIEKGSLRAFFENILKKLPDDAIKDLDWKKVIGHYLLKAKYIYLNKTEGSARITDGKDIDSIEMELKQAAHETGVDQIPTYVPMTKKAIIKNIDNISKSLESLNKNDKVYYDSEYGRATFNLDLSIDLEKMEDLITGEIYESVTPMILKVKKPDYLGDSMWEFKHGSKTISAKITHTKWLRDFQDRNVDVRPQDSLVCNVKTINKYDFSYELLSVSYEVVEVLRINPRPQNNQMTIDDEQE